MTVMRRIVATVSGLLGLLVAVAAIGIGALAWVRSWRDDLIGTAGQEGTLTDPAPQALLDTLSSRTTVFMIVIAVVAAVAVALGSGALVSFSRKIGRQLRAALTGIAASASGLLAVSSQVAAATAQTAAATNETTATVEEVKQTAILAQEKAAEAAELSQQVVEASRIGVASADRNYEHFGRLQSDMDMVAEAIERLKIEIQSVGEVLATVNDIAEQSNLLSVNASIEAAKAGEAGKGFTVVAQEVKSLAEQSKQGVARVREVLSEIQKASDVVVQVAKKGRETMELGRNEAGFASQNVGQRVAVASNAAEAAIQIAATSRQQLAGIEQISQAILSINEAGKQSVAGTRQVEHEVERLQQLAVDLEGLVHTGR